MELGDRVRIVDGDVFGVVVAHTKHLDGSERWDVAYWHEGDRRVVSCMLSEIAKALG